MKYYFYKITGNSLALSYASAGCSTSCTVIKEDGEEIPVFPKDSVLVIYNDKPIQRCTIILESLGQKQFRKILEVSSGATLDDLPTDIKSAIEAQEKTYWEISEAQYQKIVSLMIESIGLEPIISKPSDNQKCKQLIIYGTPGSGKSHKVKHDYDDIYSKEQIIRTTFHPDTDYATFVGGYKPVTEKDKDGNGKITYQFVPQSFTNAYVKAWNDLAHPYFLIIEEINRGNCAQIFGDIFQLLDRNDDGYSEYPIDADSDLKEYLQKGTDEGGNPVLQNKNGIADGKLCLPPNLNLIATMNTSDQSLFPMDTAFKRRWDWEYVPIEYQNEKSSLFTVTIGGETFNWSEFLEKINERIKKLTSSEDKQMGNFFIKHSVDEKEFINKVMFYLWSEVGKDNYQTSDRLFVCYNGTDKSSKIDFSFNELYEEGSTVKLKDFMHIILDDNSEE